MEYCIAGDDGSAGIWNRPFDVDLDGDGRLDAIGLDLDGDGLRDDALADFDGDDVATGIRQSYVRRLWRGAARARSSR